MGFKKSKLRATSPKTKKAKKPKKKTLGQLHKQLVELCQKWARISRADDNGMVQCFTCPTVKHYKNMSGGHYIPKTFYATRYDKDNIRPQCTGCNIFKGGNLIAFRENLVLEIGRCRVEIMELCRKATFIRTREWLEQQIVDYDREIRILEKGLPS
jgi:hypothetical protein